MKSFLTIFLLVACMSTASAESPQVIAEVGLRTIYERKAADLDRVAHPELKSKIRSSQLLSIYAASKKSAIDLRILSDLEVMQLFCEALDVALPLDDRFDYACEYVRSEDHGGYMLLSFKTGPRSKSTHKAELRKESVVLKKEGEQWFFLWSLPMAFNTDPTWDARKEMPNKSSEPMPLKRHGSP